MAQVKVGDLVIVVGERPEWGGPIYRVDLLDGKITFTPAGHGDYAGLPGVEGPPGLPEEA